MKKTLKGFILGVIITTLLMSTSLGAAVTKTIEVAYNSVNLTVNGKKVESDNILYEGTTYVPLRAIAEMLGKDVGWEQGTLTASVNDKDIEEALTITVNDKEYEADYLGKVDMDGFKDYKSRDVWMLKDAYEDVKDYRRTGNVLPYTNYPMWSNRGQVYVIDYTKKDGSVTREFHRFDGLYWDGRLSTEEFIIE